MSGIASERHLSGGNWATNLLAAGAIAILRPATAALRRRRDLPDGVRQCAAVNLRGEASKFVLSALSLNRPADLPGALQHFLRGHPELRWTLAPSRHTVRPRPNQHADVVTATFAADGSLQSLTPLLDGDHDERLVAPVSRDLVRAYNRSRHEDDTVRPAQVWYEWTVAVEHHAPWSAASHRHADALARRILSATWLSFDESADRFATPDFYRRKHGGLGCANVVARNQPDGSIDLWFQFHHATIDGCPAQEAVSKLAATWGRSKDVAFPSGRTFNSIRCGQAHGRSMERVQDFIDFTPLLDLRKRLVTKLDTAVTGRAHLSAVLIWALAQQPEFAGRRFSVAVDVPADAGNARTFTFLPIRPADFFDGPAGPRLSAYVREFNRLLTLTRRRQSPAHRAFGRMGLLPAPLRHELMAANPQVAADTFGTVGVTLLRDAEIFLAPMADHGFDDGFLAIGNMNLPTADGRRVGSATFAAPAGRVAIYPVALRRAIERCREWI